MYLNLMVLFITSLCNHKLCIKWPNPEKDELIYVANPIESGFHSHWIPLSIIKQAIKTRAKAGGALEKLATDITWRIPLKLSKTATLSSTIMPSSIDKKHKMDVKDTTIIPTDKKQIYSKLENIKTSRPLTSISEPLYTSTNGKKNTEQDEMTKTPPQNEATSTPEHINLTENHLKLVGTMPEATDDSTDRTSIKESYITNIPKQHINSDETTKTPNKSSTQSQAPNNKISTRTTAAIITTNANSILDNATATTKNHATNGTKTTATSFITTKTTPVLVTTEKVSTAKTEPHTTTTATTETGDPFY